MMNCIVCKQGNGWINGRAETVHPTHKKHPSCMKCTVCNKPLFGGRKTGSMNSQKHFLCGF